MDSSSNFYRIRFQGKIHERWQAQLGALKMTPQKDGYTLLQGHIQDQSQLVGIINFLHSLNLRLISVACEYTDEEQPIGNAEEV